MKCSSIHLVATLIAISACTASAHSPSVAVDAGADSALPDTGPPSDAQVCDGGSCKPCVTPATGELHSVAFEIEGESRHYFAYVPSSYRCGRPTPLLVDFHGTSSGAEPEIAYGQESLVSSAEREGFIAVRPRSRSSGTGDDEVYRWDQNPGDIARNERFVQALLVELSDRYNIDPHRTYASGFSSGTNMASRFLFRRTSPFVGYAFIGGGTWLGEHLPAEAVTLAPRIYRQTGYRDYMGVQDRMLAAELEAAHFPEARIRTVTSDIGHDLYDWHIGDLWAWLDRGQAPDEGAVDPQWTQLPLDTTASITEIAQNTAGHVLVTTTDGIWRREAPSSAFNRVLLTPQELLVSDACITDEGLAFAVAEQTLYQSADFGAHWTMASSIPEFAGEFFGSSFLTSIDCMGDTVLAGGYWTGVQSTDGGQHWRAASMPSFETFAAQIASVHLIDESSGVAAGYYDYLGAGPTLDLFTRATDSPVAEWFSDVTSTPSGRLWAVGDSGVAAYSDDGGALWNDANIATSEDLYAIAFVDDLIGAVSGRNGTVFTTVNGGIDWQDASTGTSDTIAGLAFTSATTLLAGGDHGRLLARTVISP